MIVYDQHGYVIHKAKAKRCNCFLVEYNGNAILWDTCMSFNLSQIYRMIEQTAKKSIDAVFISHAHTDHAANAQRLSQRYSCPIYVHSNGRAALRKGHCEVPRGISLIAKATRLLAKKAAPIYDFSRIEPCAEVDTLSLERVQSIIGEHAGIIELPGHSNDSIGLIINGAVALVGDVFVNSFGQFFPPFANEPEKIVDSWRALAALPCTVFYPGHGKPADKELLEKHILRAK